MLADGIVIVYEGEEGLHNLLRLPLITLQKLHSATCMKQISKERRGKVKAEGVNAGKPLLRGADGGEVRLLCPLQYLKTPLNHLLFYHELDDGFSHYFIKLS